MKLRDTAWQSVRAVARYYFYKPALLSRLLQKYEEVGNTRGLALLRRMSPVAWQHIFLNGHYIFISEGKELDLDAMIEGLTL